MAAMGSQGPHIDVSQWLAVLNLTQYGNCFKKYSGVEEMLNLTEADIKLMGVKNGAHRAQITSCLFRLKSKYEKGNKIKSGSTWPGLGNRTPPSNEKSLNHYNSKHHNNNYNNNNNIVYSNSNHNQIGGGTLRLNYSIIDKSTQPAAENLDKCGMEPVCDPLASPRQLRKSLEWELSLDNRDLRSHAWYHGTIPRHRAEELVIQDGEFLIRDCISQPGDYVLTCRWKNTGLHFVINKVIIHPNTVYERIQFRLEDDCYDSVPDLVTCYVGSGKPLSMASGARINRPMNRSMPLSFYATRYGLNYPPSESSRAGSPANSLSGGTNSVDSGESQTQSGSGVICAPYPKCDIRPTSVHSSPPLTPHNTPIGSPSLSRKYSIPVVAEGTLKNIILPPQGGVSETRGGDCVDSPGKQEDCVNNRTQDSTKCQQINHLSRVGSEPVLVPPIERKQVFHSQLGLFSKSMMENLEDDKCGDVPPPKPSRIPSMRQPVKPLYAGRTNCYYNNPINTSNNNSNNNNHNSSNLGMTSDPLPQTVGCQTEYQHESDSGNCSGDSGGIDVLTDNAMLGSIKRRPQIPLKRRRPYSDTRHSLLDRKSTSTEGSNDLDSLCDEEEAHLKLPVLDIPSCFSLSSFITFLLPNDNKPLDAAALSKVKSILLDCGPRVLASHLTYQDLDLLKMRGPEYDYGLGITSGLEIIALPEGQQLRKDLIERLECLKLFVASTILTTPKVIEQAELIDRWIKVAVDTKTSLGNLYGFTGIMMGLSMEQVQRLRGTWLYLRQNFTESALTFETKLRPTLIAMNEGVDSQPPNATIPYFLPFILILEKDLPVITRPKSKDADTNESTNKDRHLYPWEYAGSDYGLQLMFSHLNVFGRLCIQQIPSYRRNGQIALESAKFDELVLDVFRTEFHLRFLWGCRGAGVASSERHAKFTKVLTALADKHASVQT